MFSPYLLHPWRGTTLPQPTHQSQELNMVRKEKYGTIILRMVGKNLEGKIAYGNGFRLLARWDHCGGHIPPVTHGMEYTYINFEMSKNISSVECQVRDESTYMNKMALDISK